MPMSVKVSNSTTPSFPIFWLGLTGVAIWLAFLACLPAVWGSSEAREAHVVALMNSTAEYILPLRNGLIPSKPPLFHWLATVLLGVLPITPIVAARWVSVFSAVLVLQQVRLLGARLSALAAPSDLELQRAVQWLAPALLVTSYGFVTMATDARVDMCFAALVLSALVVLIGPITPDEARYGVSTAEENRRFSRFFALCGLAALAKGPLGLVLPTLAGVCWYTSTRGVRAALRAWCRPRIGWALFGCLALPWYLLAALKGGEGFVGRQLLFENLQRLVGGEFVNAQPWYFYLQVTALATFPWSLVFLGSSARWMVRWRQGAPDPLGAASRPEIGQVRKFLFSWYWLGFFLFSAASGKRPSYLLPLLPAVSLQAAIFLAGGWQLRAGQSVERLRHWCMYAVVGLFAIAVTLVAMQELVQVPGVATIASLSAFPRRLIVTVGLAQALFAGVVAILFVWWRACSKELTVSILFALWFLVMSTITSLSWLTKGEFKGFSYMAQQIVAVVDPSESLRVVRTPKDEYFDPLLYYLNRQVLLQRPELRSLSCPGFTLARADWFAGVDSDSKDERAKIVLETQEWRNLHSIRRESSQNRLVLVRCE